MVYVATMTLVMAEKDPPVFLDFLGLGRKDESFGKHPQPSSGLVRKTSMAASMAVADEEGGGESVTKAISGNAGHVEGHSSPGLLTPPFGTAFPTASEPFSDGWLRARAGQIQNHGVKSAFYKPEVDSRIGKKRESSGGRESLQERLQMSVEALENSRPSKVPRGAEPNDDKKKKSRIALPDELNLSMHIARPPSKGVVMMQPNALKPEVSPRTSNKQERAKTPLNVGVSPPIRGSHLGQSSDKLPSQIVVESNPAADSMGLPPLPAPPLADEGSRTGKGSGLLAGLQQGATPSSHLPSMSGGPAPAPRKPKTSAHSIVSDTNLAQRHQFPTPPSRQLTIFYGGQAHVFDDVSVEKANGIMMLAGSNGRSWSTAYSPRQTASIANSASEGSLSALERERTYVGPRGGAPTLTPEVKTLLRGIAQSSPGRSGGHVVHSSDAIPATAPLDHQMAVAERSTTNGGRKDAVEKRSLPRPTPCTDDNAKEPLVRGQQWM